MNVVSINTVLAVALWIVGSSAFALPEILDNLPSESRIWENRSGQPGSDYSDYQGGSVAYVTQEKGGWYFQEDDGRWHRFSESPQLDLSNLPISNEAFLMEVVSGTAFSGNGNPGQYGMLLDGATGKLVTENGFSFDPAGYELLRGSKGSYAYYNVYSGQWRSANPILSQAMTKPPSAPYTSHYLSPGMVPDRSLFQGDEHLLFDIPTLTYRRGSRIAGFHPAILDSYRRWNNQAGTPCAAYSDYPGHDVIYVNGNWYKVVAEDDYRLFSEGRYLAFDSSDVPDFLSMAFTAGTSLGEQGPLEDSGLRLDGETGQLVDAENTPVDPSIYNRSGQVQDCGIEYTLLLDAPLTLTGIAGPAPFTVGSREITLLRTIPLRQVINDPFNYRTLPVAINEARFASNLTEVVPPPAPAPDPAPDPAPPPAGGCPLNTALTVTTPLPAGAPLANTLTLTNAVPPQLGVSETLDVLLNINNPLSMTDGVVSLGAGYTLVSGSALGTITEGTPLTYQVRRNTDSSEYEISLTFTADIVFDDPGIIIDTLTGRLCVAGGPS